MSLLLQLLSDNFFICTKMQHSQVIKRCELFERNRQYRFVIMGTNLRHLIFTSLSLEHISRIRHDTTCETECEHDKSYQVCQFNGMEGLKEQICL